MGSMTSLIDILILFGGLYILYSYYLLQFKGEIKAGVLVSKETPVNKCIDKAGYIKEMAPITLIYGLATTICGAIGVAEGKYNFMGMYYLVVIVIFLAFTIWFAFREKKMMAKYWPQNSASGSIKEKSAMVKK